MKREMTARAKSERDCKEAEERLREMQEAMENHQRELQDARDTIARLEQQLRETQVFENYFNHIDTRIFSNQKCIPKYAYNFTYIIGSSRRDGKAARRASRNDAGFGKG